MLCSTKALFLQGAYGKLVKVYHLSRQKSPDKIPRQKSRDKIPPTKVPRQKTHDPGTLRHSKVPILGMTYLTVQRWVSRETVLAIREQKNFFQNSTLCHSSSTWSWTILDQISSSLRMLFVNRRQVVVLVTTPRELPGSKKEMYETREKRSVLNVCEGGCGGEYLLSIYNLVMQHLHIYSYDDVLRAIFTQKNF